LQHIALPYVHMALTVTSAGRSIHGCTLAFSMSAVLTAKSPSMGLLSAGHICPSWIYTLSRALKRAEIACTVCSATGSALRRSTFVAVQRVPEALQD
jgi:hypothetical protein